jgi:uncharacterized protein YllA (UPF0747 family)
MPPVFPRISATIVEPRVARVMEKHGIALTDAFRGRDFLKRRAVDTDDDGKIFDAVRGRLEEELGALRSVMTAADPTLLGALETSLHKMLHQLDTLRTKYVNAVSKRSEALERHLDLITNSLFPEKKLQERVLNVTSFLARYGAGTVERLQNTVKLDTAEHQLVEI